MQPSILAALASATTECHRFHVDKTRCPGRVQIGTNRNNTSMTGRIFISYRRTETAWAARALFERLWRTFPSRVFIDLESIALGADFTQVIDEHLSGCHAMLAVIGKDWQKEIKDREQHQEDDFVRIELARALKRGIPVVPVLIDGAAMPKPRDLPGDLKSLAKRAGLPVTADTFDAQTKRIEDQIRLILDAAARGSTPAIRPAAPVSAEASAVVPATPAAPQVEAASPVVLSEPWMDAEGRDAYGRWADLRVNQVVQRLRWIEPGEFWMGSTEAERRRFAALLTDDQKTLLDGEKPRHRVRLTQGFWLADTACTQALWQTVVGDNPSHFTGDLDLPVEQVSWDDVTQKFLRALNQCLKGVQAFLPTEAQWEYACRAGAETAYSFGDLITTDQVNYDGIHPLPNGQNGTFRKKTLAVKSLPPNAWGLFQMHGNVWEGCADAPRSYATDPVSDPDGGQDPEWRVVRGGTWESPPGVVRAAFRLKIYRGYSWSGLGFRFALRSNEQVEPDSYRPKRRTGHPAVGQSAP